MQHIDENVISLHCYGKVFYATNKDVAPGDELLVYYGPSYARLLKIDLNKYFQTSPDLRVIGFNLNNVVHRHWMNKAGLEAEQMKDPPSSWLSTFLEKFKKNVI